MNYFESLPKIITPDQNGYPILMTNILARASIVQELLNNPMQFYEYAIQDGDTPEIVADKYYEDPFKYWIVLFSNQILDPVWEWPMTYEELIMYIDNKYASEADDAGKTPYEYVNSSVYEYRKILTTTNTNTETQTVKEVSITKAEYDSLSENTESYDIPGGTVCIVSVSKTIVTLFDYENNLNESRRQIKLLNNMYSSDIEEQLKQLMKVR
jgi:hypothetical protein